MRAVYKLSSESANKENGRRAQLLAESPELADLHGRLERNAADKDARSRLVAAYIDDQLYWAAYELLTGAEAMDSLDAETNLSFARIWDVWGQYDLALKYAERTIAAGDESSSVYDVIGRINLHRKEPLEAIHWYTRAVEQGDNATMLANLGYAYILVSDWQKAKTNLERAIALDATLPEAHNNLAVVLMRLGDDKAALSELLKTAQAHVAFNNMGVLYMQESNLDQAEQFFQEALRLEPSYEIAERNLKMVQTVLPIAAAIPVIAIGNPAEDVKENLGLNCPPSEGATPSEVEELVPPTPIAMEMDLRGSPRIAETDAVHLDQQRGAQPIFADATALARVRAKSKVRENRGETPSAMAATVKDSKPENGLTDDHTPAVLESDGTACRYSRVSNAQRTFRSILSLDVQRLMIAGIIGLLLTTAAIAIRSNKAPLIAKVTPK
jgi:tetratricopeptide (TPR) repeat protein